MNENNEDLDIVELRDLLLQIYSSYLIDKENVEIKTKAYEMYIEYMNLDFMVPPEISGAIGWLISISVDAAKPRPTDEQIRKIISNLEKLELN